LIEQTTQAYNELKYRNVLKYGFHEMLSLKEEYVIGNKGKVNPRLLLKYVKTVLILINPICPHFSWNSWESYFVPAAQKVNDMTISSNINEAGWFEP